MRTPMQRHRMHKPSICGVRIGRGGQTVDCRLTQNVWVRQDPDAHYMDVHYLPPRTKLEMHKTETCCATAASERVTGLLASPRASAIMAPSHHLRIPGCCATVVHYILGRVYGVSFRRTARRPACRVRSVSLNGIGDNVCGSLRTCFTTCRKPNGMPTHHDERSCHKDIVKRVRASSLEPCNARWIYVLR